MKRVNVLQKVWFWILLLIVICIIGIGLCYGMKSKETVQLPGHDFSQYLDQDIDTVIADLKEKGIEIQSEKRVERFAAVTVKDTLYDWPTDVELEFGDLEDTGECKLLYYRKVSELPNQDVMTEKTRGQILQLYDGLVSYKGEPGSIDAYYFKDVPEAIKVTEYNRELFIESLGTERTLKFNTAWWDLTQSCTSHFEGYQVLRDGEWKSFLIYDEYSDFRQQFVYDRYGADTMTIQEITEFNNLFAEHPEDVLLYPDTLLLEDGSYGWMGIAMNSTKEEVETAIGKELGEAIVQYDGSTLYNPMYVAYGEYRGYAEFVFKEERLTEIRLDFKVHGPEYEKDPEDIVKVDAVYTLLTESITDIYGECHYQSTITSGGPTTYGWFSDTVIDEEYRTRLEISCPEGLSARVTVKMVPDINYRIQQEPYEDVMGYNFAKYFDLTMEETMTELEKRGIQAEVEDDPRMLTYAVQEVIDGHACVTTLQFYSLDEGSEPILISYTKRFEKEDSVDWAFVEKTYDYLVEKLGTPEQVGDYSYRYIYENASNQPYERAHFQKVIDSKKMSFTAGWCDDWRFTHAEDTMEFWDGKLSYMISSSTCREFVMRMKI